VRCARRAGGGLEAGVVRDDHYILMAEGVVTLAPRRW
jgi:hypothetical protein